MRKSLISFSIVVMLSTILLYCFTETYIQTFQAFHEVKLKVKEIRVIFIEKNNTLDAVVTLNTEIFNPSKIPIQILEIVPVTSKIYLNSIQLEYMVSHSVHLREELHPGESKEISLSIGIMPGQNKTIQVFKEALQRNSWNWIIFLKARIKAGFKVGDIESLNQISLCKVEFKHA